MTIIERLKKAIPDLYSEELIRYIDKDAIKTIAVDAVKADLDRNEDKFYAAALRMLGLVHKAAYCSRKNWVQMIMDATAVHLFREAVEHQRHGFSCDTDRGIQDLYPVKSKDQYWI